jgi:hypothetical protein
MDCTIAFFSRRADKKTYMIRIIRSPDELIMISGRYPPLDQHELVRPILEPAKPVLKGLDQI